MIKHYKIKTCLVIDMKVLAENNISIKEHNRISKYENQKREIKKKMQNFETTNLPVIRGILGMTKKTTDKHINRIHSSPSLYEQEKNALCGTAHLLRRLLSMWMKNITQKWQQKG